MMNLPRLLLGAVRVYHVYARPLDTFDQALHAPRLEDTEAKYAAKMDCGEYGRVRCKPATMHRRACLHNAAVRRHLARRLTFEWVRGHAGHPENERADQLAVRARDRHR